MKYISNILNKNEIDNTADFYKIYLYKVLIPLPKNNSLIYTQESGSKLCKLFSGIGIRKHLSHEKL